MMLNILFLIFIITGYYCLSKICFSKIKFLNNQHWLEDYILHSALGLAIVFFVILILGFTGLLYKSIIISIFIIQIIGITFFIFRNKQILINIKTKFLNTKIEIILVFFICINLFFHLIGSLAPAIGYDGLTYHLALPKLYLQAKTIYPVYYLFQSFFPSFSELFFMFGLTFSSTIFAKLYHWYLYLLTILLLYKFLRDIGISKNYSLIGILFFISIPAANRLVGYAKNTYFLIFFNLISIYYFYKYIHFMKQKYLLLNIFFVSVCNNIKYEGLINYTIILFFLFILLLTKQIKLKRIVILVGISLILSSTFYVRNILKIGNPVYPFFGKYFNLKINNLKVGKAEKEKMKKVAVRFVRHFSGKPVKDKKMNKFYKLIRFPYSVSIDFQYYDYWKYAITPLFFIFFCYTILLCFYHKTDLGIKMLIIYIILYSIIIYLKGARARYLLPVYPVLCLLGIRFIYIINKKYSKVLSIIIIIILMNIVLVNIPLLAAQHISRIKVVFGLEDKDTYLKRKLYPDGEFYKAIKWVNNTYSKDTKFFIVHRKNFYFNVKYIIGYSPSFPLSPINRSIIITADDLYNKLKELQITHIFYSHKYAVRFSYNLVKLIKELENKKKIIVVKKFENNIIYKIKY